MPRPCPYPFALFSLILNPLKNEQAKDVIAYPDNSYLVLILPNSILALDIGFYICKKLSKTLIILRQSVNADIFIKGFSIAKI
jgi:hypothetical protein